jgi:hypothetical protein
VERLRHDVHSYDKRRETAEAAERVPSPAEREKERAAMHM